jgi:hypothetical protein
LVGEKVRKWGGWVGGWAVTVAVAVAVVVVTVVVARIQYSHTYGYTILKYVDLNFSSHSTTIATYGPLLLWL